MMGGYFCVIVYIYLALADRVGANYTYDFKAAQHCRQHISKKGYVYDTYYYVDSEEFRPVKSSGDTVFEMHIAIEASSNGHILLSRVTHPSPLDPVYEIVIGGGNNKFTELRRNIRRNARMSAKTPNILSAVELRGFYIKISEDGLIEIGRELETIPLLSYYDANPLTIKYFSFAAWNGVEAIFLYDCPIPGSTDAESETPYSQEVEPKTSVSDQLRRTLLLDRQPSLPPAPIVNVKLGIKVTSVSYNAYESKLTTSLAVIMKWTDESMAWFPGKFNGTTSLKLRQGQIWRPKFLVTNSDDTSPLDTSNPDLITVKNTGEATIHFRTRVYTWCADQFVYTLEWSKWPRDDYSCTVIIEPWEVHEKILLSVLNKSDDQLKIFADIDEEIENEWEVQTSQLLINRYVPGLVNLEQQRDRLDIIVDLKRHATAYNIVFYTPLIVLVIFVLMSFWSESLTMSRVWFYAGCIIVICMGLSYIECLIPTHTIPSILVLYVTVLSGVLLALIFHVILMSSFGDTICNCPVTKTLLIARWIRNLFFLPPVTTCSNYESFNEAYATQEEDSLDVQISSNGNIEEMQSDNITYGDKTELTEIIDKLMFVIYSVTFAIMLAAHF